MRAAVLANLLLYLISFSSVKAAAATFPVTNYGALCNSNAVSGGGTDDTAAFNAAEEAAASSFASNGSPQTVTLPAGSPCRVDGMVTIESGVTLEGPGTIIVSNQTTTTLLFQNADRSGVADLSIIILSGPGGNNGALTAIGWASTSADSSPHSHFFVRNNTIIDGSWGIFVRYDAGTGALTDVDISGNSVTSSAAGIYTNADGIHVAGNVSSVTINANRVSNRGDACIALSSEAGSPPYVLSGAVVSDNICINDSVGLDNSGATNVVWSNNVVRATFSEANISNPAARSIPYGGVTPLNVKFIGNYLQNFQGTGTDATAKVDDPGGAPATYVDWIGNTIVGASAMWIAGNSVALHDNVFSPGASVNVNYDVGATEPTQNIMIGFNYWLGSGIISATGNAGLLLNNSLAHQQANGTITVNGQSNFRQP